MRHSVQTSPTIETATLVVSVTGVKALSGSGTGPFPLSIKTEFATYTATESENSTEPIQVENPETPLVVEPAKSFTFEIPVHTKEAIEAVVNNCISVKLYEVNDKPDKKKKKDKGPDLNLIGTTNISLAPLAFEAVTEISDEYAINLRDGTTNDGADNEKENETKPTLSVSVKLNRALLTEEQQKGGVLVVTEPVGVYNVPAPVASAPPTDGYALLLPLPGSGSKSLFESGTIRAMDSSSTEFTPAACTVDTTKISMEERKTAESEGTAVIWNSSKSSTVFLDSGAKHDLIGHISKNRFLPVELRRVSKEASKGKGKQSKVPGDDDLVIGFRSIAYCDVSSLLYPGATDIFGAFPCSEYVGDEIMEKSGFSKEALDELWNPPKPAGGSSKKPAPPPSASKKDAAPPPPTTEEHLKDSNTYLIMKIHMSRALIPRRSQQEVIASVSELIPPRDMYPKHAMSAEAAVSALEDDIVVIAEQLLEEFREANDPSVNIKELRINFFEGLQKSGKYFAFKEQMKRSIVKVVREKFGKTSTMTDREERQDFLTKLYAYLIEHVHAALNKHFKYNTADLVAPLQIEFKHVQAFAKEAEERGDLELAATYHQECVARRKKNADCWYNYACFCLRVGDYSKAEECARESVSLDQSHGPSLLVAALVSALHEVYDVATKLFDATTYYKNDSVTWTVRYLYHASLEDEINAEMCLLKAMEHEANKKTLFLDTARLLLHVRIPEYLDRAMKELMIAFRGDETSEEYQNVLIRYQLAKGAFEDATQTAETTLKTYVANAELWALQGHAYYGTNNQQSAQEAYSRCLDLEGENSEEAIVRSRLAGLLLDMKQYAKAKDLYVQICQESPSALAWEGVGIACYRLGNLKEAETALAESNVYDSRNARAWGYLSLVNLKTGRKLEAEQTYKYAIKLQLNDKDLIEELQKLQTEAGYGNPFID
eukprot:m.29869 g.29869  ORF g.29869 m.29869 type:complete len:944 (+) comp8147_c0_seq1:274-3105(+)